MTDDLKIKAANLAIFISQNNSILELVHNKLTCLNNTTHQTLITSTGLLYEDDIDRIIIKVKEQLDSNKFYCFDEMPRGITKNIFNSSFFIFGKTTPFFAFFDCNTKRFTFSDNSTESFIDIINECYNYFRILSALSSNKFNDYHNEALKQIVFYSNSNGILKINYSVEPVINNKVITTQQLVRFESYCSNDIYKSYLINAFFSITDKEDFELNINDIISQIETLINAAYVTLPKNRTV
jgi:hypothetical protein